MVRRNHVQTDWWTHYPFDLYNKTCKSKTVDILCVSKSCKERLVDTWPIRPIQQNMQSEDCCYTMCVKIMQKQTLGGHMTHSTHTTKHAIRRLLLYIVYQNHAQNVWRTHDPFDLHTETQKIQSFCGTWCIKVMQKNAGGPIADSTSTNKMQNANFESRKQTRNWSATSARGARAKSGAHRCAWSANPAVALPFLLACVCVCV